MFLKNIVLKNWFNKKNPISKKSLKDRIFLFIEINSGLKPFSLSLLSLFIYIFILPKVDNSTSFNLINSYIYIMFFYIGLTIMWALSFGMDERIFLSLIVNLIIDLLFFGVFL